MSRMEYTNKCVETLDLLLRYGKRVDFDDYRRAVKWLEWRARELLDSFGMAQGVIDEKDVVYDTIARIMKYYKEKGPNASLPPYVKQNAQGFSHMKNAVRDAVKRYRRHHEKVDSLENLQPFRKRNPDDMGYKECEVEDETNFFEQVSAAEEVRILHDCIEGLRDARMKLIMNLRVHDMSYDKIGSDLDISETRVWQLYCKAIQFLKNCLERNGIFGIA